MYRCAPAGGNFVYDTVGRKFVIIYQPEWVRAPRALESFKDRFAGPSLLCRGDAFVYIEISRGMSIYGERNALV